MAKVLYFYLLLFINFPAQTLLAQNQLGSKLTALGMNSAAIKDIWNIEGNVAGITGLTRPTIATNYVRPLYELDLSDQGLAFVLPYQNSSIGICFHRYGTFIYNEAKIGFAFAKQFGDQFAFAVKVNFHQLKINNYGSTSGFSTDIGLMYKLNERLTVGLSLNNPFLQGFNNKTIFISVPTIIEAGLAFNASNKILIATTVRKSLTLAIDVGIGIDYKILQFFSFRGGITVKPFKEYAGFGFSYKKLVLDVAIQNKLFLGYIPQISLAYAF